jgi:hypothetical protein
MTPTTFEREQFTKRRECKPELIHKRLRRDSKAISECGEDVAMSRLVRRVRATKTSQRSDYFEIIVGHSMRRQCKIFMRINGQQRIQEISMKLDAEGQTCNGDVRNDKVISFSLKLRTIVRFQFVSPR